MKRLFKTAKLYPHSLTIDAYGEQASGYGSAANIEIAVSLSTGTTINTNNVITQSSTHIGVTPYRLAKPRDKIVEGSNTYIVDYVTLARYAVLYLKQDV